MASSEHLGGPEFDDEDDDEVTPIDDNERQALHQDLLDVKVLKAVIGSRGVRGVVVYCPECEDDHFLGWDLLAGNLQEILESGKTPVHEPAWEPDPDEYVSWDYARGFLDGYETYPEERAEGMRCGYCGNPLPEGGYEWSYCPTCGRSLAPVNLVHQLRRKGWSDASIGEVMERCGFELPIYDGRLPDTGEDDSGEK
ncbi:MAG: DUF5319 family protein [Actinomycetota bacterium]